MKDGSEGVETKAVPMNLRTAARDKAAQKGYALPDGSFPIRNAGELVKAMRAYGRANPDKRAEVVAHIKKRAKALGLSKMVENWAPAEGKQETVVLEVKGMQAEYQSYADFLASIPDE